MLRPDGLRTRDLSSPTGNTSRVVRRRVESPEHDGVDAVDLRWPGYLGAEYRRGGVVCVANVHRDFASGGFGATAAVKLVDDTRAWRDEEEPREAMYRSVSTW